MVNSNTSKRDAFICIHVAEATFYDIVISNCIVHSITYFFGRTLVNHRTIGFLSPLLQRAQIFSI